jgi:hypothetical protein
MDLPGTEAYRSNHDSKEGPSMCECSVTRRSFVTQAMGMAAALGGVPGAFRIPTYREIDNAERPFLEAALRAWRWIDASRIVTPNGMTWPADPTDPTSVGSSFYTHSPGVIPFALELFYATGDEQYLDAAKAGANHHAAALEEV